MTNKQHFDRLFYEFVEADNQLAAEDDKQSKVRLLGSAFLLPDYVAAKMELKKAVAKMVLFYVLLDNITVLNDEI